MTEPDSSYTPPPELDPAQTARQIAVTAASLAELAQQAGLVIVARLLNLVRMEAEIKLSEIKFRPPADSSPTNKG
ncbi:MAG: hypothetical protein KDJ20_05520 [Hyphomicrobiales bacterium]|nr:hypothetical protein [Rhodoblastus sp.]MCC0001028.1 hypothetical protein [Methylobacteriaceae bacterium]MCC2103525.1 hypothetical protein [Hyphomicrobiales bacterium]HRY02038.1 hypothetical protein [Beijerinckiaceae bacterium]MCB1524457.1 hypothetical protein [Rhodoblastus sp.]